MSKNNLPRVLLNRQCIRLCYPTIQIDPSAPEPLRIPRDYDPLVENHIYKFMWDKHEDEESYAMEARYCGWTEEEYERHECFFIDHYSFEFAKGCPVKDLESLYKKEIISCKQLYMLRPLCYEMQIVWEKLIFKLLDFYPDWLLTGIFNAKECSSDDNPLAAEEIFDTSDNRSFLNNVIHLLHSETSSYLERWRKIVIDSCGSEHHFARDFLLAFFAPVDKAFIASRTVKYWYYPYYTERWNQLSEKDFEYIQSCNAQILSVENCLHP